MASSAERMWKLCEKRKEDPTFDEEKHKEMERKRISKYRRKKALLKDRETLKIEREKEAVRKRKYSMREEGNEVCEAKDD